MKQEGKQWKLYVLSCKDDTLYCGITNDLDERIKKHQQGKGAKYTRSRTPVTLLYSWDCEDRSHASKQEYRFKSLNRKKKLKALGDPNWVAPH